MDQWATVLFTHRSGFSLSTESCSYSIHHTCAHHYVHVHIVFIIFMSITMFEKTKDPLPVIREIDLYGCDNEKNNLLFLDLVPYRYVNLS